jgi:hypothetical protein
LLRKWVIRNSGKMLSDAVVDDLLGILHNSVWDSKQVAKNSRELKKCDSQFLSEIVCKHFLIIYLVRIWKKDKFPMGCSFIIMI